MEEELVTKFLEFLGSSRRYQEDIEGMVNRNERLLQIDLEELKSYSPALHTEVVSRYLQHLDSISKAMKMFTTSSFGKSIDVDVSFYNLNTIFRMRDLKSEKLGSLVSFRGTVTRTTQVRPELVSGDFECKSCNSVIKEVGQQFRYTEPLVCPNHLCTNRKDWNLKLKESKFCNWQRAHVQEVNTEIPAGALPRHIDVVFRNDMVESVRAGDTLVFTGYLAVVPDATQLMMPQSRSVPLLSGVSRGEKTSLNVKNLNYKFMFIGTGTDKKIDVPINNLAVESIRGGGDVYFKLSQSLFPNIHGHFSIKNAILLMLVGGVSKRTDENMKLRGDINILLVGDPGTAKSQFLKQCSTLLDRSVYTSGKSSSAAGLTASVLRDIETGEFAIEAGALMLADNGVCCIDEFDKMNYKDQVSIHEAMEQQTITIAKAGIHATLNAKCSILAAANPVNGRYDKRKTLKQNINLSAPIMSRFDLYFVLIDDVDYESDANIATHILNNHLNIEKMGYYPIEDVRCYLQYVSTLEPKINDEAHALLVKNYVKLRQDTLIYTQNYKMTVRYLESMIRLSEALAKIHCDKEVRPEHVEEAFRLVQSSMIEVSKDDVVFKVGESVSVQMKSKDYEQITGSLVYILKTREGMTKEKLVEAYLEENEQKIESEDQYFIEKKNVENTLFYLIHTEGVLYESDDVVFIHPNYDI